MGVQELQRRSDTEAAAPSEVKRSPPGSEVFDRIARDTAQAPARYVQGWTAAAGE